MTCPFGSSTVSVTASNNGFGFSVPADVQIVVTDYAVDVSPPATSIAAGGTSTHVVTVTPQGGAVQQRGHAVVRERQSSAADLLRVRSADGRARVHRRPIAADHFDGGDLGGVARIAPARTDRGVGDRPGGGSVQASPCSLQRLGFSSQTISTTTPQQFVYITNSGTAALAISSITVTGDFAEVNNCGIALAVGRKLRGRGQLYADRDGRADRHPHCGRRRGGQSAHRDVDRHRTGGAGLDRRHALRKLHRDHQRHVAGTLSHVSAVTSNGPMTGIIEGQ